MNLLADQNEQMVTSLTVKQSEVQAARKLQNEMKSQYGSLKERLNQAKSEMTTLQSQVNSEASQPPDSANSGNTAELEATLARVKREEIMLKDKLEAIEENMVHFMGDMGALMEQHDVGHVLGSVLYGGLEADQDAAHGPLPGNPLTMSEEDGLPHDKSGYGGTGGPN